MNVLTRLRHVRKCCERALQTSAATSRIYSFISTEQQQQHQHHYHYHYQQRRAFRTFIESRETLTPLGTQLMLTIASFTPTHRSVSVAVSGSIVTPPPASASSSHSTTTSTTSSSSTATTTSTWLIPSSIQISFSPLEQAICHILLETVKTKSLGTQIRFAGGWVRDKLLGRTNDDIDVAVDNMSGAEFAAHVVEYMKSVGIKSSSVGVIQANPDQSKHLETATTRILDMWVDFVHLRTETYDASSRIPTISIGTPQDDAERRDLTVNALFYNVTTDTIEDHLGGMSVTDLLHDRIIRTPLPPKITFLDDPLRVLRAMRFSSRLGYSITPELKSCFTDTEVVTALSTKVSRERVGKELDGMLTGGNGGGVAGSRPVSALRTLYASGLLSIVYAMPISAVSVTGTLVIPPNTVTTNALQPMKPVVLIQGKDSSSTSVAVGAGEEVVSSPSTTSSSSLGEGDNNGTAEKKSSQQRKSTRSTSNSKSGTKSSTTTITTTSSTSASSAAENDTLTSKNPPPVYPPATPSTSHLWAIETIPITPSPYDANVAPLPEWLSYGMQCVEGLNYMCGVQPDPKQLDSFAQEIAASSATMSGGEEGRRKSSLSSSSTSSSSSSSLSSTTVMLHNFPSITPSAATGFFCAVDATSSAPETLPDHLGVSPYIDTETRRYLTHAAVLFPLSKILRVNKKGKSEPLVNWILVESLKQPIKLASAVASIHAGVHVFHAQAQILLSSWSSSSSSATSSESISGVSTKPSSSRSTASDILDRVLLGNCLRKDATEFWQLSLFLAAAIHLSGILRVSLSSPASAVSSSSARILMGGGAGGSGGGGSSSNSSADSSNSSAANAPDGMVLPAVVQQMRDVLFAYASIQKAIQKDWCIDECWAWKPLLDGKIVQQMTGLISGPALGAVMERVFEWRLVHPHASPDECKEWLISLSNK